MSYQIKINPESPKVSVDPQLAAKHFDIVIGLDFHVLKVPWPITPCPITPFMAVIFDPMEYIHITIPFVPSYNGEGKKFDFGLALGGNLKINGFYKACTTSSLVGLPSIPPIPGKFSKLGILSKIELKINSIHFVIPYSLFLLPLKFFHPHEGQISHGSKTVSNGRENLSTMFCRSYSCQDIGKILFNNPTGGLYLNYLTTILTILPMGKPVMIGGEKVERKLNLEDLINALISLGLGKAAKFIGKKALEFTGKQSTKVFNKISNKNPKFSKFRNSVQSLICKYVGEPVDAASGHMTSLIQGFELAGPIPFKWDANYFSDSRYQGPLGKNIYHSYDISLQIEAEDELIVMNDRSGRPIVFPTLNPGESFFNPKEKHELHRDKQGNYYVSNKEGLYYYFDFKYSRDSSTGILSRIADRDGFSILFTYNNKGHLQKIRDSAYREIIVDTDKEGKILSLRLENPNLPDTYYSAVSYQYDEEGRMIRFFNAEQYYNELFWEKHLIKSRKFNNGVIFSFEYDKQERCTSALNSTGLFSYRFKYLKDITEVTNSEGTVHTYYHHNGIVNKIVNSQAAEQIFIYDEADNLLVEIDEKGASTSYEYDERSNITSIEQTLRGKTSIKYNSYDQPTEITLATGASWKYEYNEQGKLTRKINPLGKDIAYHYMPNGLLAGIKNVFGETTYLQYNSISELVKVTLPNAGSVYYEYDKLGRCTLIVSPTGASHRRKYDLLGQIIEIDDNNRDITKLKYDSMGNAIEFQNKHRHVTFNYNFFGDVTIRKEGNSQVKFRYDKEGQLTGILNENFERYQFDLDSEGNVIKEIGFDGREQSFLRNTAGQVVQKIKADGHAENYSYNSAGDLIYVLHQADQSYEEFEYDITGAIIKAKNKNATVSFKYNAVGNLLEEKINDQWIRNEYNENGQRIRTTSSLGADISLNYDPLKGWLNKLEVNGWHALFKYDNSGQELSRDLLGGIREEKHYDKIGRLTRQNLKNKEGKTLNHRQYIWDGDRLKASQDSIMGEKRFAHDIYGNLSEVIYGDGNIEYRTSDLLGNLYNSKDMKDRKYDKGSQLVSKGNTKYKYDKQGNLIEKQESKTNIWHYQWDECGMLKEVIRPNGYKVSFDYDALGRRLYKRFKHTTTHYLWDGNTPLHEYKTFDTRESTTDDIITWVFEIDSFVPIAKIKGDKKYSILTDHLGTPIQGYNDSGDKIWERELDSHGKIRKSLGENSFCNYLYQGQTYDNETDLAYNRFRYYDPEQGNYISQDPIGLAGGNPTIYGYVSDVNAWVDVLGLTGFYTQTVFNAPSGNIHTVYKQSIDWNLPIKTSSGIKTNLELTQMGKSPFVVKNGKYSQINLHHSQQNAKGSLFELSAATHNKYKGSNALHPYMPGQHPENPVNRDSFNTDREAYWKHRAKVETKANVTSKGC